MSRSELRQAAMERDKHRCAWPRCTASDGLEMAHIWPIGMGGRKSSDTLDNVWMLCKRDHSVLDSRVSWKQAQPRIAILFDAYTPTTTDSWSCSWPTCRLASNDNDLCVLHLDVLTSPSPIPGRTREIRALAAAYVAARFPPEARYGS